MGRRFDTRKVVESASHSSNVFGPLTDTEEDQAESDGKDSEGDMEESENPLLEYLPNEAERNANHFIPARSGRGRLW